MNSPTNEWGDIQHNGETGGSEKDRKNGNVPVEMMMHLKQCAMERIKSRRRRNYSRKCQAIDWTKSWKRRKNGQTTNSRKKTPRKFDANKKKKHFETGTGIECKQIKATDMTRPGALKIQIHVFFFIAFDRWSAGSYTGYLVQPGPSRLYCLLSYIKDGFVCCIHIYPFRVSLFLRELQCWLKNPSAWKRRPTKRHFQVIFQSQCETKILFRMRTIFELCKCAFLDSMQIITL